MNLVMLLLCIILALIICVQIGTYVQMHRDMPYEVVAYQLCYAFIHNYIHT